MKRTLVSDDCYTREAQINNFTQRFSNEASKSILRTT